MKGCAIMHKHTNVQFQQSTEKWRCSFHIEIVWRTSQQWGHTQDGLYIELITHSSQNFEKMSSPSLYGEGTSKQGHSWSFMAPPAMAMSSLPTVRLVWRLAISQAVEMCGGIWERREREYMISLLIQCMHAATNTDMHECQKCADTLKPKLNNYYPLHVVISCMSIVSYKLCVNAICVNAIK